MLETPSAVADALRRYRVAIDYSSGSVVELSRGEFDRAGDPFRPGFLSGVEERAELVRRMVERLKPRDRLLLVLWFVSDMQVTAIARRLGVSRVHCYRLRDKALRSLSDPRPRSLASKARAREGSMLSTRDAG